MGNFEGGYKPPVKLRPEEYRARFLSKDRELLQRLPVRTTEDGDRYVIEIDTDRGLKTVDWYTESGDWKVRNGRGEGQGIYKMARYFQLIPRREREEYKPPSEPKQYSREHRGEGYVSRRPENFGNVDESSSYNRYESRRQHDRRDDRHRGDWD